ncbi:hypothetical protein LCGC14_2758380 [marine sediment metagenome]|uniref:Uncharacterized protein n=1 Tax=marine sediment metagenome TaxID=412755 RepID=A0A0F8ZLP4_9ZZZZ
MEHKNFPVKGFEFMDEQATETQKDIIFELAIKAGRAMNRFGKWPDPFTKWDAGQMIYALKEEVKEQ